MKGKMPKRLKIGRNTSLAIKQIRYAKKYFSFVDMYEEIPCECCGYKTEGIYDICSKCGWEQVGTKEKTGANPVNLKTYKTLYNIYG